MRCQQHELYAAESYAGRGKDLNLEEARAWVDAMRDTWWWELWYSSVEKVELHTDGRWSGSVGGWHPERGCGHMEMDKNHMCELFILHELAHVLAAVRFGSQSHDPAFARTYLELVYLNMGSSAYQQLHARFLDAGIECTVDEGIYWATAAEASGAG